MDTSLFFDYFSSQLFAIQLKISTDGVSTTTTALFEPGVGLVVKTVSVAELVPAYGIVIVEVGTTTTPADEAGVATIVDGRPPALVGTVMVVTVVPPK